MFLNLIIYTRVILYTINSKNFRSYGIYNCFFGTKPYDEASFNEKNKEYDFELRYYKGHLNKHNVILTQGVDAVCIFVNDTADAEVLRMMADNGVKLLALRCAGYNNVDLKAAAECGITVVRVPAYSPYAVAEYTVALMLSLNRKIPVLLAYP